jgi:hypothetical protein
VGGHLRGRSQVTVPSVLDDPRSEVAPAGSRGAAASAPLLLPVEVRPPDRADADAEPVAMPPSDAESTTVRRLPTPARAPARLAPGGRAAGTGGVAATPAAHDDPLQAMQPPAPGAGLDDGTTLVADALRALRQEGKPALAARLLEDYLARHADGPLAEEALALSIEAHVKLGDARARTQAAAYLRRYPAGRFRETARQASGEPSTD